MMFLMYVFCVGCMVFFVEVIFNFFGVVCVCVWFIFVFGCFCVVRVLIEVGGIYCDLFVVFCEVVMIWWEEGGDLLGDVGIFFWLVE